MHNPEQERNNIKEANYKDKMITKQKIYRAARKATSNVIGISSWVLCDLFFYMFHDKVILPLVSRICTTPIISKRFQLFNPMIQKAFIKKIADVISEKGKTPMTACFSFGIVGPLGSYILFESAELIISGVIAIVKLPLNKYKAEDVNPQQIQ